MKFDAIDIKRLFELYFRNERAIRVPKSARIAVVVYRVQEHP